MSDDELAAAADRIIAGLDFARAAAATDAAHRQEVEALLHGFVELVDSLHALEWRCRDLREGDAGSALGRTVERILRQALGVLARAGVEPVAAAGVPLDLARHEVVEVRRGSGHAEDTVVEEVVRGYVWRQRLLRRAKVAIASGDHDAGLPGGGDEKGERA